MWVCVGVGVGVSFGVHVCVCMCVCVCVCVYVFATCLSDMLFRNMSLRQTHVVIALYFGIQVFYPSNLQQVSFCKTNL